MLYTESWLLGSKTKWNKTTDTSTDNKVHFSTVLACNCNTNQAHTNIKTVVRLNISVIRKFPLLEVRSRKHNTQKAKVTFLLIIVIFNVNFVYCKLENQVKEN